ncbi:MAG: HNH endonuclease, partial [Actinobacteria bacterium]
GCQNRRFVDAHHIRHWAHGGETNLDNLVTLCRRHHRLVHEGGYGVESLPRGRLRFRDSSGRPLPDTPRPSPGSFHELQRRNRSLRIDGATYRSGAGDRLDLDLAVAAMLAARSP